LNFILVEINCGKLLLTDIDYLINLIDGNNIYDAFLCHKVSKDDQSQRITDVQPKKWLYLIQIYMFSD
jgi:hypothetical protein